MRISRPMSKSVRRPAPASMPSKPIDAQRQGDIAAQIRDIGTGNLPFRPKEVKLAPTGTNNLPPGLLKDIASPYNTLPKPVRPAGSTGSSMGGPNIGPAVLSPTGTRGTLVNDAFGGPTSGPGAPISQPGLTGGASSIPAGGGPSYGMPAGGNIGAPATSTFQGGTSGGSGMAGGMPNTSMPNTSMPPAGAAFKRGGAVKAKKMASGGMTSKAATASKRGDGIAQRGKTKGRMV